MNTQEKKRDRRRWSAAEISSHLDAWKQSGLSRKKFSQQHGINPNTFSRWVTQNDSRVKSSRTDNAFLKIELPASSLSATPVMELINRDELRLVFYCEPSASLLKELFRP